MAVKGGSWLVSRLALGSAFLLVGCGEGTLSGGKGSEDGTDSASDSALLPDAPGGVTLNCGDDLDLAESPLLKLSTVQYRNTVRDLLGRYSLDSIVAAVEGPLGSIPDDSLGDGFRGLDDRIALEHVQGFFNVGVAVGDAFEEDPSLLTSFAPSCSGAASLSDACWNEFSSGFLQSVYRRPLSSDEQELFATLNAQAEDEIDALRSATIVALSSPRFIYQVEIDGSTIGGQEDLLQLDAYEVASRLSYTFWQTMPDEQLFEAAENGTLLEDDVYESQLMRVWNDPRAHATLEQFWTEWLKLEKFTGFETARPAFQSLAEGTNLGEDGHDYYADMVAEVHALTTLFTFEEPGSVAELLRTNISVTQSDDLAALYGVEAWDGTSAYPTFAEGERAGLLQRGALLVSNLEQTNPFHRGALVRRAILCDQLPQPDPNELPPGALDAPPFDPAQTTRDRFTAKVDGNSLCEGCHAAFSDIGYVMESYDALGRFRTTERVFDEQSGELIAELSIDTTGDVRIASSTEDPVANAAEMNERIAASGKVEACMAESYFSYVARRATNNASLDRCVIEDLSSTLAEEDGGLASAFQRVARISTFFSKKVGAQ